MSDFSLRGRVPMVDVEDSGENAGLVGGGESCWGVGLRDEVSCVASVTASAGVSDEGSGDNGVRSCFSFIVLTIFSRSIEVMCFSLRLLLSAESCRSWMGRFDELSVGNETSKQSSDEFDSMLDESSGSVCGVDSFRLRSKVNCGCERSGAQQKVSLEYIRQLRFSKRFPSAICSAHLLKTALRRVSMLWRGEMYMLCDGTYQTRDCGFG